MRRMLLAAPLLAVATVHAQGRLLLEDADARVTLAQELRCGTPALVEVTAEEPELFARDSRRLQSLLDATRAMLGFECRDIPEIRVTGRLRGLEQPSYQATASAASRWLLASTRHLGGAAAPRAAAPPAATPAATVPSRSFAIRELTTGIGVDEAMRRARRSFDTAPSYDSRRRELAVVRGSCELSDAAAPRPGSLCMRTLFTGGDQPLAYRLHYSQVVDRDQVGVIAAQLRERFGPPAVDREERGSSWLRGGAPERRLGWGGEVEDADGAPRRELEAHIRVAGDATVLSLDLLDPALSATAPRYQIRF